MAKIIATSLAVTTTALLAIGASDWIAIQDGIVICGSPCFVDQTTAALAYIGTRCPEHLTFISTYLDLILPGTASRVDVGLPVSICTVAPGTRHAGITWYASCLAHEAYHVYLQRSGLASSCPHAEILCLRFQRRVATQIRAPSQEIQYLSQAASLRYWEVPESEQNW